MTTTTSTVGVPSSPPPELVDAAAEAIYAEEGPECIDDDGAEALAQVALTAVWPRVLALVAEAQTQQREQIADAIAGSVPYNAELNRDGTEDPTMSAYVEGVRDAWQIAKDGAA